MASASNPTALAKLLESVSVSEPSAAEHIGKAERALLDIFGIGIEVFDDGTEGAEGFIATKLGLQCKNSTIQTGLGTLSFTF